MTNLRSLRLRTQLLIAAVLVITALSGASLLILRHTVQSEISRETRDGLTESVRTFEAVQGERQSQLFRTAAMLSELPPLKALLTTEHGPTIQDASATFWELAASDLLLLAQPNGTVLGVHVKAPGWSPSLAQEHLQNLLASGRETAWWYEQGSLYWVVTQPVTTGKGSEQVTLGLLVLGYRVDDAVARELARASASEIILANGTEVIASTLSGSDAPKLYGLLTARKDVSESSIVEADLGSADYEVASVVLKSGLPTPIRCYVLLPLGRYDQFLHLLNRSVLAIGIAAVILCAILFSWISKAVTKPLERLVEGIRAFAEGDAEYAVTRGGSMEVADLSTAFSLMRTRLIESQRHKIEAERVIALSRAATSISHDLRHYLATVVANAELLYEAEKLGINHREVYDEIKTASEQMTDLIDSLKELSREHGTLSPVSARIDKVVKHAVETVQALPQFRNCPISVTTVGSEMEGVFDPRRLDRVFLNLLINACEAASGSNPKVAVEVRSLVDGFEVSVTDNGSGVPDAIQDNLFEPFVSSGKVNGTGLGLAIVSKIVAEHNGTVRVASTSAAGTTMVVLLPRSCREIGRHSGNQTAPTAMSLPPVA